MKLKALFTCLTAILTFFFSSSVFAIEEPTELRPCVFFSHCACIEIKSNNLSELFQHSIEAVHALPRTEIIDKNDFYIHAKAETKIMHFVDDLEIKAISDKSLLQIRSESRVGIGDFGVNQRRIDQLAKMLRD